MGFDFQGLGLVMLALLVLGAFAGALTLFAAPQFLRAVEGFFLLAFCFAGILVALDNAVLGWALLASCGAVSALCKDPGPNNDQFNDRVTAVPACCALWILGLILLGTFQETFLAQEEVPFSSAGLMDVFGTIFHGYLFAVTLFVLLGWGVALALEEA
jgi:hypothetical protein